MIVGAVIDVIGWFILGFSDLGLGLFDCCVVCFIAFVILFVVVVDLCVFALFVFV